MCKKKKKKKSHADASFQQHLHFNGATEQLHLHFSAAFDMPESPESKEIKISQGFHSDHQLL